MPRDLQQPSIRLCDVQRLAPITVTLNLNLYYWTERINFMTGSQLFKAV